MVWFLLVQFSVQVPTWWWSKSSRGLIVTKGVCICFSDIVAPVGHRWELLGNYSYFEKYGNLLLGLENYALFSLPPIFTNTLYTYPLRYIIHLGEPSGNIISNYHGKFIHICIHWYDPIFKKIYETVFFPWLILPLFLVLSIFLLTIYQELFHYLQSEFFISVDISKVYVMSYPTSQSYPAFHSFFNNENISAETAT